jgi:hypothetical protein
MKTQRIGIADGSSTYRQSLLSAMSSFLVAPPFSKLKAPAGARWTASLLVWAALLMVWGPASSLSERWTETYPTLAKIFPGERRAGRTYQGFIKALVRWSPRLLLMLEGHWRTLMQQAAGKHWLVEGFVPIGVDGSRVALPHTQANLAAFGRGGKDRSAPSAWLVMLLHLGSNLPWAWKIARAIADERGLLKQMLPLLPELALLIADAGYTGYHFWQTLQQANGLFLIRVGANMRLLTKLGYAVREHESLVYLWPDHAARRSQPPLILRLIVLHDGRKPIYLLTNVLELARLSDAQAAKFYRLRWNLELFFRALKQTMGKRQMRSHAPLQAALELRWAVMGLALVGLWCLQSQNAVGGDPCRVSLASALRHLRALLRDPFKTCRPCKTLQNRLHHALRDAYHRKAPKVSGHWPHKKNEPPPGAPKIQPATPRQILAAQLLAQPQLAA